VILVDVSGDLMRDLGVFRRWSGDFNARLGRWDYTDPRGSLSWNWVSAARDADAVVSMVEALVGRERPNDPQPFFQQRDRRTLRALIGMQNPGPPLTAGDLLALLHDQPRLARQVTSSPASRGARQLTDVVCLPPDDYETAVAGVVNALEALDHPGVEAVTRGSDLDLDRLFDTPTLLIVGAPLAGSRTSEAVGALILSQIIRTLYKRFGRTAGTHVYLIVDEAPRLTSRINFEEILSVSRRARVSVCLAAQDVTQFGSEDERNAILANCATYVGLPTHSKPTATYLAGRLGDRVHTTLTLSSSVGIHSRDRGTSHSLGSTPVLGVREIMSPPWGERVAVVHSPQVCPKPFVVDLTHDAWT
jgi:type IV secretory pathway TraG/TraD family ATPase VirD4